MSLPTWLHASLDAGHGEMIGYFASALVLATFCMKSMLPLRITAIGSNFAFIAYAVAIDIRPVLILHTILLPVNVMRLVQLRQRDQMDAPAPLIAPLRPPRDEPLSAPRFVAMVLRDRLVRSLAAGR